MHDGFWAGFRRVKVSNESTVNGKRYAVAYIGHGHGNLTFAESPLPFAVAHSCSRILRLSHCLLFAFGVFIQITDKSKSESIIRQLLIIINQFSIVLCLANGARKYNAIVGAATIRTLYIRVSVRCSIVLVSLFHMAASPPASLHLARCFLLISISIS